jgi:hypothetical protein
VVGIDADHPLLHSDAGAPAQGRSTSTQTESVASL